MNTQNQNQKDSAQKSSKVMVKAKKAEIQKTALMNAVSGQSFMNYETIVKGFLEMGIAAQDIIPRENVFTFNAWKALGRVVKKGQHGVKVVTWVGGNREDETALEIKTQKKYPKTTTVFHISQTEPLDNKEETLCTVH